MDDTRKDADTATQRTHLTELFELAERQHGVVSRTQARGLGISNGTLSWMVRSGRWQATTRDTLTLRGTGRTPLQQASITRLSAGDGAAISHWSAAALWGIPGFALAPFHVLVPHGRQRLCVPGPVHHTRRLPPHHLVQSAGLLVTTPPRTIFDLSGVLGGPWRLERALDHAWAARLVSFESMMHIIDELSGRGQRNVAQLRALVGARGSLHIAGESSLERRFHRLIADDGQPPMTPQSEMSDDRGWWGRVDAADHEARLIVEIDGDRWHASLSDQRTDEHRRHRAEGMGYRVLRFTEHDVWHKARWVATEVRLARTEGRRSHHRPAAAS